ncbi:MAG: DUF342 domain-containing protein, partial [Candidatus Sericytochromatia bacterium]|nr:DUF342 domain-containing protein [Candidatus Sericytochromatia bacterium]
MAIADTVTFAFHDDGQTLLARYAPAEAPETVSRGWLRHFLTNAGHGELFVFEAGLDALAAACTAGTDPVEIPVAERRDAELQLSISPDGMAAYATLIPAYGGTPIDELRFHGDLYNVSICFGLQAETIRDLLRTGEATEAVIAVGRQPEPGKNASFEQLVGQNDTRGKPKVFEDGTVDFYDLGTVVSVDIGDALLRKHEATDGEPGSTVLGEPIASLPGRDALFGPMGDSVEVSPTDPLLVVAARGGLPRFGRSWVKVEPILIMQGLDLSTGNIHFDGNVIVNGPIQAGLSLWAAGDIVIEGVVEA